MELAPNPHYSGGITLIILVPPCPRWLQAGYGPARKNAPPHIGYHAEFGRSALNDVGINAGEP